MKFHFKLLIYVVFVAANLNAMQPLKRVLPAVLRNRAALTSRQCLYLSHVAKRSGHNGTQLAPLAPKLNYCPMRSFSSHNQEPEKVISAISEDLIDQVKTEQNNQFIEEQKQKAVLKKVMMILEDEEFKAFLDSDDFSKLLESDKFKALLKNPNYINKVVLPIFKNEEARQILLNNEIFLKLMKSSQVKKFVETIYKDKCDWRRRFAYAGILGFTCCVACCGLVVGRSLAPGNRRHL